MVWVRTQLNNFYEIWYYVEYIHIYSANIILLVKSNLTILYLKLKSNALVIWQLPQDMA
jgi:hypothetical protein